jgi:hypothetical protein
MSYLLRLALNRDPPDLCLLSGWDYRREALHPAEGLFLSTISRFCLCPCATTTTVITAVF